MRSRSIRSFVVLLIGLLAACGSTTLKGEGATAALEALFPTLEAYGVTAFHRTAECDHIVYRRGAFQSDADCSVDVMGPYPRESFDEVTDADVEAILRESDRLGGKLDHAYPEYGDDGTIVGGVFGFEWCRTYFFERGWRGPLPNGDTEVYTSVNADWYEESVCFF